MPLKYFSKRLRCFKTAGGIAVARKKGNRTTLTDVARKAGVSPATASMVLSGKGEDVRLASDTIARVRAIANDLDYSPNLLVHSLQQGASGVLAFFTAFRNLEDDDLYMDRLARGLEQAAGRRGRDLLIHCAFDRSVEETYRSINGGHTDGLLLFAPHPDDPILAMMRRSRFPCVLLNARDPEGVLPSVRDDVRQGMTELGRHLAEQGHRHVACLHSGTKETPDAEERIDELAKWIDRVESIEAHDGYAAALTRIFAEPEPPTALFGVTDRIAYWLLPILERMEIRVPEDVSVVGYDGLQWPCDSPRRVTSVAVDFKALAAAAVAVLLDGPPETKDIVIPTHFQPGATLGPA